VPEPVQRLGIRQVGEKIVLTLTRPASRTDDAPLGPDAVLEMLMSAREPSPRRPAEIEQDPAITWRIPVSEWDAYAQGRRIEVGLSLARIAQELKLQGGGEALRSRRLSFIAIVGEGGRRRRSEPSEVQTLIVCAPPPAPAAVAAKVVEEGILVSWSGTPPFRIYRQQEGEPRPDAPLNETPITGASYLDASAVLGTRYRYQVRSVAGSDAGCESGDSSEALVTRLDTFAPAAPEGLAAVAEGDSILLFWRPNREPDLRGYRVFRAEGLDATLTLLTPEDLTATSYTDRAVVAGMVYVYAVTARDGASPPNESPLSETATERMEPPR